jgi:hypothetical protein
VRWAVARWSNFDGIKDESIPRDFSLPAKEPKETPRDSMTSISSKTASKLQPADDEEEALRARLEAIGMHVGANFSERCTAPPCAYISTYVSSDCAGTNLSLRKR